MKRKQLFLIALFIVTSVIVLAAAPPFRKIRLQVINKTGETIWIKVERAEEAFYSKVDPGTTNFSITPEFYRVSVWACESVSRVNNMDLTRNFRITVPKCFSRPATVRELNNRKFLFSPN